MLYTLLGYITEYTKKLRENIITIHNSQIVFFLEHFFQLQPFMSKLMINLLKFVKEKKIQNKDQAVKQGKIPKILNSLKKSYVYYIYFASCFFFVVPLVLTILTLVQNLIFLIFQFLSLNKKEKVTLKHEER